MGSGKKRGPKKAGRGQRRANKEQNRILQRERKECDEEPVQIEEMDHRMREEKAQLLRSKREAEAEWGAIAMDGRTQLFGKHVSNVGDC